MDTFKHSLVTALAAIFGNYLGHKVPGVDPLAATGFIAALIAGLFHFPIAKATLNTPPPGDA
jgi:hypothetical protein